MVSGEVKLRLEIGDNSGVEEVETPKWKKHYCRHGTNFGNEHYFNVPREKSFEYT